MEERCWAFHVFEVHFWMMMIRLSLFRSNTIDTAPPYPSLLCSPHPLLLIGWWIHNSCTQMKRQTPRTLDSAFRDGGAYPQLYFVQFPMGMGRGLVKAARHAHSAAAGSAPVSSSSTLSTALTFPSSGARVDYPTREAVLSPAERTEETVAATYAALEAKLLSSAAQVDGGPGTNRRPANGSLTIFVAPPTADEAAASGELPIIRSPTKNKKSSVWLQAGKGKAAGGTGSSTALTTTSSTSTSTESGGVAVPSCISAWRNKKKLIIPIEQRIAHEVDERTDTSTAMGDHMVELAIAMRSAQKEVQAEQEVKLQAQREEAERQQAALEAEEALKAQKLQQEKAAALAQQQQRKETRAERLERIRVERELREREQREIRLRRLRERAAKRLNMSVEALEEDEELRRQVDAHAGDGLADGPSPGLRSHLVGGATQGRSSEGPSWRPDGEQTKGSVAAGGETEEEEDDDGPLRRPRQRHLKDEVFTGTSVTNEGIRRELDLLAQQGAPPPARPTDPRRQAREWPDGYARRTPCLTYAGLFLIIFWGSVNPSLHNN
eukprot:gene1319-765_t